MLSPHEKRMNQKHIVVSTAFAEQIQLAERLATELGLNFSMNPSPNDYDYALILTPNFIGLQHLATPKAKPFYIDFLSDKLQYRSQQAGTRKELIARAMGFKPIESPTIIDVTAGLGRDSFILASLGFKVTLIERSSIIYTLLADALARASKVAQTADIVSRMHLVHANAIEWLPQLPSKANVIYMDPMFPERKKSASVKKEMVILQDLLGKDTDSEQLFELALSCSQQRVVVKRPRLAANITERAPNFSLTGKSSRFDIYLV